MSSTLRRTKIVATLGPSTESPEILEAIIRAGANVVRMNFSHGTAEDHKNRAQKVREIAAKLGRHVALLGDLQGPKIRVSTFKEGKIILNEGEHFILDAELAKGEGTQESVGIDYKSYRKMFVTTIFCCLMMAVCSYKLCELKAIKSTPKSWSAVPSPTIKGLTRKAAVYRQML